MKNIQYNISYATQISPVNPYKLNLARKVINTRRVRKICLSVPGQNPNTTVNASHRLEPFAWSPRSCFFFPPRLSSIFFSNYYFFSSYLIVKLSRCVARSNLILRIARSFLSLILICSLHFCSLRFRPGIYNLNIFVQRHLRPFNWRRFPRRIFLVSRILSYRIEPLSCRPKLARKRFFLFLVRTFPSKFSSRLEISPS